MEMCVIYSTAETKDQALTLGGQLVEEGLIACANVIPGMISVYRWQEVIEEAQEVVLILKTRRALAKDVVTRLREIHNYENPAILVLPVEGGNPAYLDWIARETAEPGRHEKNLPEGVDVQVFGHQD